MDLLCDVCCAHAFADELEVGADGPADTGRAVTMSATLRGKELLAAGFGFGACGYMGGWRRDGDAGKRKSQGEEDCE